jgi:drug/metabolite transporter (DMT)-like permease
MITPFCVQLLYGLLGPLNKAAISTVPFTLYVGIKLFLAGSLLIMYQLLIKKQALQFPSHQWPYYLQIIGCGAIGAQYLKYWGLQYVSASKAAFLFNSSPFFVAFFSWIRWREHLVPMQWLGLSLSFAGLIPIFFTTSMTEELIGIIGAFSFPECAILAAAGLHAISFTAKRHIVHTDGYASARVNGIYLCAGGVYFLISWIVSGMPYDNSTFMTACSYAISTTFLGKVICSSLTLYLLRYYSATFLSCMEYWYPLCVAFWSWCFWGAILSYHYWISTIIVFCGQLIFYSTLHAKVHTPL